MLECLIAVCLMTLQPVDRLGGYAGPLSAPKASVQRWSLYGRVGVVHWRERYGDGDGMSFRFSRTGPKLEGRIYIGVYREF